MRLSTVSDPEFSEIVANSESIAAVLKSLGLPPSGGSYAAARKRIKDSSLDDSHFLGQGHSAGKASWNRKPPEEMLILRTDALSRYGRKGVLRAMLESGVPYECAICLIVEWQGKQLVLHIDHIDGNWRDDRIQNLRFLCPNCHSQTDTWGGKGGSRRQLPALGSLARAGERSTSVIAGSRSGGSLRNATLVLTRSWSEFPGRRTRSCSTLCSPRGTQRPAGHSEYRMPQ
jgi:5-methylcytosine-specific restriction endonuclease McrA